MKDRMKVAHFCSFAPNQCGMYHTAKDLIIAERLVGIDAGFIAYGGEEGKDVAGQTDGEITTLPAEWAMDADVLVRHTAIPDKLHWAGIPIVIAMHGRPESSFRLERSGENCVISAFYSKAHDCRYKAFITFWPEYMDCWKQIVPTKKLYYVPSVVNLKQYEPVKENVWDKYNGNPNILIADIWRDDITPLNMLFAAAKFRDVYCPTAKVHVVGIGKNEVKPLTPIMETMRNNGSLGFISGQTRKIQDYYKAADIVITPHVIATRIIRESLASGVPVVAGSACKYTPYTADPLNPSEFAAAINKCWQEHPIGTARRCFGLEQAGNSMKKIFESVIRKEKPKTKKLFIDIGGHLGESVLRFYREVEDADEYRIITFEPEPNTFKKLQANIGHIKNVFPVQAAIADFEGKIELFTGGLNDGEGSTTLKGKKTGKVDYSKPIEVDAFELKDFIESIKPDTFIVIKMNIEGGEYSLMEYIIKHKLFDRIDRMYIQCHADKLNNPARYHAIEQKFIKAASGTRTKLIMTSKGMPTFNGL